MPDKNAHIADSVQVTVDLADLRIVLDGLADPNPRPSMKQMVDRKVAEDRIRRGLGDTWDEQTGKWVRSAQIDSYGADEDA